MRFTSSFPSLDLPTHLTTWDFLFSPESHPEAHSQFPHDDPSTPPFFTISHSSSQLTHPEIRHLSQKISYSLLNKHSFKPRDVISMLLPNTPLYPAILFGIMHAGCLPALSSPAYTEMEMIHVLKTVEAKGVVCSKENEKIVRRACMKLGIENVFLVNLDDIREGLGDLCAGKIDGIGREREPWRIPRGKTNADVCAVLCFSSGTTGLPKAVMISHQNIIAQCLQLLPTTSADHKNVLGLLPFYHITGVVKMLTLPILIHASVIILTSFTMPTLLSTITTYRIVEVQVVPPIVIRLVRDPAVSNYDLSCIKRFASGAAPISEEVLALLQERFPGRGFKQGYGMTESTGCISTHPLDKHGFRYARTGGVLVAGTEVKVVNESGEKLDVGESGEILAKGPQIVPGYYNNSAATLSSFDSEGFLRTGDIGSIDSEGFIHIHDRIKEMIKVKGVQVAPAELENILLGHEKVEDCAVIGIMDDYAGERPLGFVVLKEGARLRGTGTELKLEQEIIGWVKEKTVRSKWLAGVRFVEQIPKSASGKILRRVLRDRIAQERKHLQKPKL